MKELLEFILKNITTHPEDVKIEEGTEEDMVVFTITVHPEDMGRVIGKSGKVINAIRTLVRVAAVRTQQRVRVNLADSGAPMQSQNRSEEPQAMDQLKSEVPASDETDEPEVAEEMPQEEAAATEPTVEDLTGSGNQDGK